MTSGLFSRKVLWKQKGLSSITVTLNLPPNIEASLVGQARAEGLSLDHLLSRKLKTMAESGAGLLHRAETAGAAQWESRLDQWLDSFFQDAAVADDDLKRENWYPDRW